jgi:hypothetical protein
MIEETFATCGVVLSVVAEWLLIPPFLLAAE